MLDSWTFNKIAGAVLGTALMTFGLGELAGAIYHPHPVSAGSPGYKVEVAEATPAEGAGEPAAAAVSIGTLLASADATKGATEAKACAGCHNFDKGGANKTGPDLWDIVQRPRASHEGFEYSEAMKSKAGEPWTYENLNAFILAPKTYVPGTKMGYGGLKNDAKRANLIAYLATLSDAPKPFPAP